MHCAVGKALHCGGQSRAAAHIPGLAVFADDWGEKKKAADEPRGEQSPVFKEIIPSPPRVPEHRADPQPS